MEIIEIKKISSGFCQMPDAIFHVASERGIGKWKARFIVGLSYLYALSYQQGKAVTTSTEIMSIMQTNSRDTLYRFKEEIYLLQRYIKEVSEESGMYVDMPDDPVMSEIGRKGKTIFYLIDQTAFSEAFGKLRGTFSFLNVSLLLPVSVQAKAILLYLNRKARGGSLLKGDATAEVRARELAEVLSISKRWIKEYLYELENSGVIERIGKKPLRFRICRLDEWSKDILTKVLNEWKDHPFLKNWKWTKKPPIGTHKSSYREPYDGKNVPIGRHKSSYRKTYDGKNVPIGRHKSSYRKTYDGSEANDRQGLKYSYRNKSIRNKSIYRTKSKDRNNNVGGGNIYKYYSFYNKNIVKKVLKKFKTSFYISNFTPPKFSKITQALARLEPSLKESRYGEFFKRVEKKKELYVMLQRIYGNQWKTLAAMFECFSARAPGWGYDTIRNPVGFLVSMSKNYETFERFYLGFCSAFGFRREMMLFKSDEKVSMVKEYMRNRLRKHEYKTWIEDGIEWVEDLGDFVIIVAKDRIIKEFLSSVYYHEFQNLFKNKQVSIKSVQEV